MFKRREPTTLEKVFDRTIRGLDRHTIGSDDYNKTMEAVVKLHKMKEEERIPSVSKDTMLVVAANLLGIILIIKHENVNVITSRALNLILKPRAEL
jgi:hypothetical protein